MTEKASIVGRVGIMLLSCGTGAWRVRSSMNALAEEMGITCTADIGLMSIEYTCFDGDDGFTQSLCLTNTGVNTSKLNRLEHFIREFEQGEQEMSGEELHKLLDQIEEIHGLYSPIALGMAAALACGGFTFLLGGGSIEMFCAFVGAGIGNFIRCKLSKHHFTLFLCIASSVSAACLVYAGLLKAAELLWAISIQHEAGYICAMLFIIPGFPFITSGIDLAKLDMRSGMERLMYALIIVLVATMSAWIMALILGLQPVDFQKLDLTQAEWIVFRLLASFCGVFGFSIMFNSPPGLAAVAAGIGAVAVTGEKSKELLDEMVKKGELTVEQGKALNEELKHNIKSTVKEKVNVKVKTSSPEELDELLDKMTPEQMALLKQRIDEMEKKQEEFEAAETVEDVAGESVCEDAAEKAAEEETAENEDI